MNEAVNEPLPGSPFVESTFSAIFPAALIDKAAVVELEAELLFVVIMDDAASMEPEVGLFMGDGKTVLLVIIEVEDQDWFWAGD